LDTLHLLLNGFGAALSLQNLCYAFIGCILGTVVGILPGLGPVSATAMLIPLTFHLSKDGAIIMLAAIYYGAMYGGTITSVLINVPGETASVITCIDGYQMARQGRAGAALSIAAIGSFIGGTFAMVGLVVAAPPLARKALEFGPPEIFGMMVFGLSLIMGLAGKSLVKGLMMGLLGLFLSLIGMEVGEGIPRFTFDSIQLMRGVDFIAILIGLFGVSEILINAENPETNILKTKMSSLVPTSQDLRDSAGPIARGTVVGFFLGLIPGLGAAIPTILSYVTEKKLSRHPEKFGQGAIEGVAGPETSNNSYANAAFIPLLSLGIPSAPTIAVLMGAFMMNGVTPGPLLFRDHAALVWTVIASMYLGNVILLILNLPLIPMWVSILRIPYSILFALILLFTVVGAYSLNNQIFDVGVMIFFGAVGYILRKLDFPLAPIALTLILGPIMENALRQSMEMSQGSFSIFWERPFSLVFLFLAIVVLITSGLGLARSARKDAEA
jgi:putative tricarboxylic transport membrane protein